MIFFVQDLIFISLGGLHLFRCPHIAKPMRSFGVIHPHTIFFNQSIILYSPDGLPVNWYYEADGTL